MATDVQENIAWQHRKFPKYQNTVIVIHISYIAVAMHNLCSCISLINVVCPCVASYVAS